MGIGHGELGLGLQQSARRRAPTPPRTARLTSASGQAVVGLWLAGDVRTIVQYNECDALTTYLLWLRAALLAGHLTPEQHAHEEELLEALLRTRGEQDDHEHLLEYVEHWQDLRGATAATFLASAT